NGRCERFPELGERSRVRDRFSGGAGKHFGIWFLATLDAALHRLESQRSDATCTERLDQRGSDHGFANPAVGPGHEEIRHPAAPRWPSLPKTPDDRARLRWKRAEA